MLLKSIFQHGLFLVLNGALVLFGAVFELGLWCVSMLFGVVYYVGKGDLTGSFNVELNDFHTRVWRLEGISTFEALQTINNFIAFVYGRNGCESWKDTRLFSPSPISWRA